jgi:hypothetical protein
MSSFSQRHGLAGPPPGTLLRYEVPVSFRRFLVELPHNPVVELTLHEMRDVVCDVLQVWPKKHEPPYYDYKPHIQECEWFRIYDIIEALYKFLHSKGFVRSFGSELNKEFVAQNLGWQLSNTGKVEMRGDAVFEGAIQTSISTLLTESKPTAAGHIKSAISALSVRPTANTSTAVSDATKAVECVLHDITGQAMTLGKYLDKYPDLFHPALKKALDGVYGFASDAGARHGKEGEVPTFAEAQFAVTTCAAACTMLTATNPKGKP